MTDPSPETGPPSRGREAAVPIAFTHAASVPEPAKPDEPEVLVVGVRSDRFDDDAAELDGALLEAAGFTAAIGETVFVAGPHERICLAVGLGAATGVGPATLRRAGAVAVRAARRYPRVALDLLARCGDDGADNRGAADRNACAQAMVEGVVLGAYRFDAHRSQVTEPSRVQTVTVIGRGGKRLQAVIERGAVIAASACLARDLVNEPGGSLTPPVMAERATAVAEEAGLAITVWDEATIRREHMGGLLGVNRGSAQPPRFVELAWEPERPRGTVALVGKGITFDSGGLSLKSTEGMVAMKGDMGGAAAVLGAMAAVPVVAPRLRVLGYLPLTDNMTGADATRVGDVLRTRDGTTVEVLNTDAEGRLVLADALARASEAEPDAILDIATLTGAIEVALGSRLAGLMGNHDGLMDEVRAAGEATGEEVWPLPLPADLRAELDSEVADIRNVAARRFGGAMHAGHFLSTFVGDDIPWAHLDIAGPAWSRDGDDLTRKGGTGFGVRLLLATLANWTKPRWE